MYTNENNKGTSHRARENSLLSGERDFPFHIHRIAKGKTYQLNNHSQNRILFIMRGTLFLDDPRTERNIFGSKHMYFLHRNEAPFLFIAEVNTTLIEYVSEFLPLINQQSLFRLVCRYAPQPKNLEEMRIKEPMYYMLISIIHLKKLKLQSRFLFDIKKEELLFFFRTLYDEAEIARFFSPFLQDQNKFKEEIFSKYAYGDNVKSLASKCCMTTKTLNRHFKKEFQTTPHRWLSRQKAKEIELYIIHHPHVSFRELSELFKFPSVKAFKLFCETHNIWMLIND